MSVLGPGNLGSLGIASSIAGAQNTNSGQVDELKKQSAERSAQIDRKAAAVKSLEDVDAAESSSDRDADGRMPFGAALHDESSTQNDATDDPENSATEKQQHPRRSADPSGERGHSLDLDA